jgi:membrane protease YdiL (CAAX protease family)
MAAMPANSCATLRSPPSGGPQAEGTSTSSRTPPAHPASLSRKKFTLFNALLLLETILVTVATIGVIRLSFSRGIADINTQMIPAVLMAAALVPTAIRGRRLKEIGLNINNIGLSARLLFWASFLILPSVFLVLWLLQLCGFNLLLQQIAPRQSLSVGWIAHQFLYAAIPEEVFFRGYLQTNILTMAKRLIVRHHALQRSVAVFASALCFAAAHVVISSQITGILTFFPGLVFGWLFLRTRSLVAPVLFHGLANTCYFLICMGLA